MNVGLRILSIAALAAGLWGRARGGSPAPIAMTASTGEVSYADLPARHPATVTNSPTASDATAPTMPREFFNAGTQQLRGGKLREAEASFESALASHRPALLPVALYN